jgi:hypothetical protein
MHCANHAWIEESYNMPNRNWRRFTFLYEYAPREVPPHLQRAAVAGRKIPSCGRDDLIVEDASFADFQSMAQRPRTALAAMFKMSRCLPHELTRERPVSAARPLRRAALDQPFAFGVVRHGRAETKGIAGADREKCIARRAESAG